MDTPRRAGDQLSGKFTPGESEAARERVSALRHLFHRRRRGQREDVETGSDQDVTPLSPKDLAQIARPKLMFISMTLRNLKLRSLLSPRGLAKSYQTPLARKRPGDSVNSRCLLQSSAVNDQLSPSNHLSMFAYFFIQKYSKYFSRTI